MRRILAWLCAGSVAAASLAALAVPRTVELEVRNMTCAACPITVRKALMNVPGVASASVDYAARTATVTFDAEKTDVEALTRATTRAGFPSSLKR